MVLQNELNRFVAKFDVTNFSSERDNVCRSLLLSLVCVEEEDVISCFSRLSPSKAQGRMALSPFLIGRIFFREHSWKYSANILRS